MSRGQASVWLICVGGVLVFAVCLMGTVAFTSWHRQTSVVECVKAGQPADACSRALKP